MTSDGRMAILAVRVMVLPRIILAHIPANRSRNEYENQLKDDKAVVP
jgi:hypothetical protein